ncbi:diphthine methyltransferase homolog isoform X2 [Ricinus communis]|uniref:diphthine methyltransferase homolog isoform X2 n=1 Tax=Ricinus communis TaxID=3988 RepID=UPI00077221EE|nr:diphthine methyltransferase homolog isoform X2 [Ricinus communis]|eukprot:XP_015581537.1 diphthine methyltransferase homolog isoform X2 [Ricinus communis]
MEVAHCYLDGNADAVEFCPHDSYTHVLAAATYTLQEGDNPRRSGSISLLDVNGDGDDFKLFHRVDTAGIFDIKWNPVGGNMDKPMLAQADADGCLRIHELEKGFLREINGEKISSSMCLCLDWNPASTSISVGFSDGSVSIISFSESKLDIVQEWKAHDFELWAASFDMHQSHLVYTGSDDCKFSCWDLRDSPSNKVFLNSRVHKMGVCCIAKNPSDPNSLLTGSYDEHLRIWDVRSMSKPVNETSVHLGGGVWRLKFHPYVPGLVLAACMHNGFAIVKIKEEKGEVIETYSKHGSLAYGADWQRKEFSQEDKQKSTLVATCSFYDRLLKIWMPENNIFV